MLTLTDRPSMRAAIRDPALPPMLRAILTLRYEQLGGPGADFHVVQRGDTFADAEAAVGFPLLLDGEPTWEWTRRHPDGWTEVVFVLSDDGHAQVLLVPSDADPPLLKLLDKYAAA